MSGEPFLSVILPALNEEKSIQTTVSALKEFLDSQGYSYRICVVDDGSTDSTWKAVAGLHRAFPERVAGIRLSRNFGKDSAILAGLHACDARYYLIMDADGQHPIHLIPAMIEKLRKEDLDVVNGVKEGSFQQRRLRRFAGRMFNWFFTRATGFPLHDASDFKLISRRAREAVLACGDYTFFFRAITQWIGFKQDSVSFNVDKRMEGQSKWTLGKLLSYALDVTIIHSNIPVHLLVGFGLLSLLISGVLGIKLLIQYLFSYTPPGYATLLLMILLSFSLLMLGIGIVGLYAKQILDHVKMRPRYIVMERLDPPSRRIS